ncbi:hypothetical protein D3C80_1982300 [compost metagenome]
MRTGAEKFRAHRQHDAQVRRRKLLQTHQQIDQQHRFLRSGTAGMREDLFKLIEQYAHLRPRMGAV